MILQKIKVLEFAGLAPAPFCGKILADYGASVVKIDKPKPPFGSSNWLDNNKRSIILDLKKPFGINIVKKICNSYDILIDPYRPGIMEKLGLGPSEIMKNNPQIIYARLSGYGQSGPLYKAGGHDINYLALSGILSILGRKDSAPTPPINLLADFAGGGLLCALGIVLALFNRNNTGVGAVVDLSMSEGAGYVGSWLYSSKDSFLFCQPKGQNVLDTGAHFYDTYETKDGRYMAVGAIESEFFAQFLQGLGLSPDEVTHFSDFEENKILISQKFKAKTQEEWTKIFERLDACVTPVLSMDEAPLHPHNVERANFIKMKAGHWEPAPAPKFTDPFGKSLVGFNRNPSSCPEEDQPPCPEPGEHSLEVLKEIGYSQDEIQKFLQDKSVVLNAINSKL